MPPALLTSLQALAAAGPDVVGPLTAHLNGSSSMQASVDALLTQAQITPSNASQIAAQIAAIPGVPAGVLAYVGELGPLGTSVATDPSAKIAFSTAIAQARAMLETATSPGMLGRILQSL